MKKLALALIIVGFFVFLSSCLSTPPEATSYFTLTLRSIPEGAAVYALNQNGTLAEQIGTTPFVRQIELGVPGIPGGYDYKNLYVPAGPRLLLYKTTEFGLGIHEALRLGAVLVRSGYAPKRLVQTILDFNINRPLEQQTRNVYLTVPLTPTSSGGGSTQQSRPIIINNNNTNTNTINNNNNNH